MLLLCVSVFYESQRESSELVALRSAAVSGTEGEMNDTRVSSRMWGRVGCKGKIFWASCIAQESSSCDCTGRRSGGLLMGLRSSRGDLLTRGSDEEDHHDKLTEPRFKRLISLRFKGLISLYSKKRQIPGRIVVTLKQ